MTNPDSLTALVAELEEYLPAAVRNSALRTPPGTGPGTLAGFRAKAAEVFQLGRAVGHDEAEDAERLGLGLRTDAEIAAAKADADG